MTYPTLNSGSQSESVDEIVRILLPLFNSCINMILSHQQLRDWGQGSVLISGLRPLLL